MKNPKSIRALFTLPGFVASAKLVGVFGDRYARFHDRQVQVFHQPVYQLSGNYRRIVVYGYGHKARVFALADRENVAEFLIGFLQGGDSFLGRADLPDPLFGRYVVDI